MSNKNHACRRAGFWPKPPLPAGQTDLKGFAIRMAITTAICLACLGVARAMQVPCPFHHSTVVIERAVPQQQTSDYRPQATGTQR
jgi:hypothetical protein